MNRIIFALGIFALGCVPSFAQGIYGQNQFLAGPASGGGGFPSPRSIVLADLPAGGFLSLAGGTMAGPIVMGSNAISGLSTLNGNTITVGTGTLSLGSFSASIGGNFQTAGSFVQSGAFTTTIFSTATTAATLPAGTHTLAGLDVNQTFSGTDNFSGTFQVGGTAQTFPTSGLHVGTTDTQTLTNKTLASSTDILGGVTMTLGSDATGDIYYRNSSGILTRLPIGGAGNILNVSGGIPAWTAATGGGNVSNSGTPTANQIAQWTNATTIQGVNVASVLTAGQGISVTGTTNATIAASLSTASNVLGADVALSNTGTFFVGPTMAQGGTGTWYASGCVTVLDTVQALATYQFQLTDGTSVFASSQLVSAAANSTVQYCASGIFTSPAGNIRITTKDISATTGVIKFNSSGQSNDSYVRGFRIQ